MRRFNLSAARAVAGPIRLREPSSNQVIELPNAGCKASGLQLLLDKWWVVSRLLLTTGGMALADPKALQVRTY